MCVCVSFTGWWARLWPSKWVPTLRTSAPQMWPTWLVGSNVVFILTEEKTTHYHWLAAAPEAPDEHFSKLMTPPRILFFFLLSILPHPRRHFVGSYSIPLCSLWLSIWYWSILKESQLGFLFCYKSSSSHVCLHHGNPSEELDMCLNKQARKKQNKTGTPDICCVWRMSYFINATQRKKQKFSHKEESAFGQL